MKPDRLMVLLAQRFLYPTHLTLLAVGLAPAVAFIGEVIVGDLTNNDLKMIVIFLETR